LTPSPENLLSESTAPGR